MSTIRSAGHTAFLLIVLLCAAMGWAAAGWGDVPPAEPSGALAYAIPGHWLPQPLSAWLNTAAFALVALGMHFCNKAYNYVHLSDMLVPSLFMLCCFCLPLTAAQAGVPVVMAAATVFSWAMLFSCHERSNATQRIFILGTMAGWGLLLSYSFLAIIAATIASMLILKLLRPAELLAYLLGIIAPWPLLVFLISPGDVRPPELNWPTDIDTGNFYSAVTVACILAGLGVILALRNCLSLMYTGRIMRRFNFVIMTFGVVYILASLFDISNLECYIAPLFCTVSIEAGGALSLDRERPPQWPWLLPACAGAAVVLLIIIMI